MHDVVRISKRLLTRFLMWCVRIAFRVQHFFTVGAARV